MSNEKEYKTIVLCGVTSNLERFVPKKRLSRFVYYQFIP